MEAKAYEAMKKSYEEAKARGETTEGDACMYAMLEELHERMLALEARMADIVALAGPPTAVKFGPGLVDRKDRG